MRGTLLDIAHSGILAPSADNRHVFQIELAETCIRLWPTSEFVANTERHRRVLGLISLGAVVENMRLRASQLSLSAHANWFPAETRGPVVQLDLQHSPTTPADDLADAIAARHTNRRMYQGPRLTASETGLLNAAAAPAEGVSLIWLDGDRRRRALGLIWRAESERFLRERLHQEIFSSIRFDLSWNESAEWALPPGALEIEAPMRPLFKALRHWSLMQSLTWVGAHYLVGLRAGWLPCWQAPALAVLATSAPIEQGAIQIGAAFERLWLRATLLGLALQPLAASTLLPLQAPADLGASDQLRSALSGGWQNIAPGITPLMVFRMGRATRPRVNSGRRPDAEYLWSGPTK